MRPSARCPRVRGPDEVPGACFPSFVKLGKVSGSGGPKTIRTLGRDAATLRMPGGCRVHSERSRYNSAATLAQQRSAWGAAGLRASWSGRSRPKLIAMAPTVGRWTSKSIKTWTKLAGVEPRRISVAWVRGGHPWAGRWQLDPSNRGGSDLQRDPLAGSASPI